jgi:hypothetical protein
VLGFPAWNFFTCPVDQSWRFRVYA